MSTPSSTTLKVTGMSCAGCSARLEKVLKEVPGVQDAQVNFTTGTATVSQESVNNAAQCVDAIEQAGFGVGYDSMILTAGSSTKLVPALETMPGVRDVRTSTDGEVKVRFISGLVSREEIESQAREAGYVAEAHEEPLGDRVPEYVAERKRFIIAAILSVPILVLSMVPGIAFSGLPFLLFVLTTPVVVWTGREFFVRAAQALRHGSSDMNTLVALGVGTAYLYSVVATFWPSWVAGAGTTPDVYFEAAAVIVALVLLGRHLEGRSKAKTNVALEALMDLQPSIAHVLRDGEVEDISVGEVQVGDRIIIRPGESIPLDGEVVEGVSAVNESMISGEPLPVEKAQGSTVLSGTVNTHGSIVVQVTQIGDQTTLQQIVRMTREAQERKAPVQHLADKVCSVFVPVVLGIAVITLIAWLIWGPEPSLSRALVAFVSVLIIACPCALGLATPTAIVVSTGVGAKRGMHFKGGETLQRLASVRQIVMDKTGTLTEGKPTVESVTTANGWEENELLRLAASAEIRSQHPYGKAIVSEAKQRGLELFPVLTFQSTTGLGITAHVNMQEVVIGNAAHLIEHGVELVAPKHATVLVAVDGVLAGKIRLFDRVRSSAPSAVQSLDTLGLQITMATGDTVANARMVAKETGIERMAAGILPGDKAQIVREMQEDGDGVAMVGDGINDTPALAEAEVGIALGTGSQVVVEAADVTLMRDDLQAVGDAVRLSRKTMRIVKHNLFFAFAYNVVSIPIAAGVLYGALGMMLNPMIASAAMAASSVSVVTNSLRLNRFK